MVKEPSCSKKTTFILKCSLPLLIFLACSTNANAVGAASHISSRSLDKRNAFSIYEKNSRRDPRHRVHHFFDEKKLDASESSKIGLSKISATAFQTEVEVDQDQVMVRGGGTNMNLDGVLQRLKIGFYFALWYALNVVYNSK